MRWSATITREGIDDKTLDTIANRAFTSTEVSEDSQLAAMLRAFIAERRSALAIEHASHESQSSSSQTPPEQTRHTEPDRYQTNLVFDRLTVELSTHLSYLDEHGARAVIARLEELCERYPQWLDARRIDTARADLQSMLVKRDGLQRQVDELETRTLCAARAGDHDSASAALKKLTAIHATRPSLFSDARFDNLRATLISASEVEEHRAAARDLIARESAVLKEVKELAAAVHEFHQASQRLPHDSTEYEAAEIRYRDTVLSVKSHDTEWLCDLIVELSDLIEDIHAPHARAGVQLDRFIRTVKRHLHAARREILEIRDEVRRTAPANGDKADENTSGAG